MGDFIQKTQVKSAVRKLSSPIEKMETFQNLINTIITTNPWGCTSYVENGAPIAGIIRKQNYYSGTVRYSDAQQKVVGEVSFKAPSMAAFTYAIISTLSNFELRTEMGGTPSHDNIDDGFHSTLKCHASNGENFVVTFKRDSITVSSYESDSILSTIETWADDIPYLA